MVMQYYGIVETDAWIYVSSDGLGSAPTGWTAAGGSGDYFGNPASIAAVLNNWSVKDSDEGKEVFTAGSRYARGDYPGHLSTQFSFGVLHTRNTVGQAGATKLLRQICKDGVRFAIQLRVGGTSLSPHDTITLIRCRATSSEVKADESNGMTVSMDGFGVYADQAIY